VFIKNKKLFFESFVSNAILAIFKFSKLFQKSFKTFHCYFDFLPSFHFDNSLIFLPSLTDFPFSFPLPAKHPQNPTNSNAQGKVKIRKNLYER
jgi:hypothetical protein